MANLSFLNIGIPASNRLVFRNIHTQEITEVAESPAAGGRRADRGVRRRLRILLKVDGQEYEVPDIKHALEVIKAAKEELPEVAQHTALQIVSTGKRIGDARREESKAIEIVEAPSSVRNIIEDRIAEMQRLHWRLVQKRLKELRDEEEVIMLL